MENTLIWLQEMEDNNESWVNISSVITMLKKEQEKAINYTRCCTELPTKKDFISELEQYQEKYKTANTEKVNNAYALGFRHCFHFINDRVKIK